MSGDAYTAAVGDVGLHFFRLPHESQSYTVDVPHYGLLITHGAEAILLPGDCAVGAPALLPLTAGRHFRLALLNFPWLTLRKGRDFIEQHMAADHIIVYHLPFAEDDTERFRAAAASGRGTDTVQQHAHSGGLSADGQAPVREDCRPAP